MPGILPRAPPENLRSRETAKPAKPAKWRPNCWSHWSKSVLSEKRGQTRWGGPLWRSYQPRTFQHLPRAVACGISFVQSSGRSVEPWGTWGLKPTIRSLHQRHGRCDVDCPVKPAKPLLSLSWASQTECWCVNLPVRVVHFRDTGYAVLPCAAEAPVKGNCISFIFGHLIRMVPTRALQQQYEVLQPRRCTNDKLPMAFSSLTIGCERSCMLSAASRFQ